MPRNDSPVLVEHSRPGYAPCRKRHRVAFRSLLLSFLLCLSLFVNLISTWAAPTALAASSGLRPLHLPPGTQTFKQFLQEGQQSKARVLVPPSHMPPTPRNPENTKGQFLPGAETPTMKPLTVTLSSAFLTGAAGAQSVDVTSSDGRLEVQLAPGSFDLTHASGATGKKTAPQGTPRPKTTPTAKVKGKATPTATGSLSPILTVTPTTTVTPSASTTPTAPSSFTGSLTMTITEQHGYFVGENINLGSYQFQFTDAQGHAVSGVSLSHAITILYHYQPAIMQRFGLDPGQLFLS